MKKLALIAVILGTCIMYTGCLGGMSNPVAPPMTPMPPLEYPHFEDKTKLMEIYSQVALDDTKADVEQKLGMGEEGNTEDGSKYYTYDQGGYGVTIAYDSTDKVFGKVLFYNDIRQFSPLTIDPPEGAAYAIAKGTKYAEAVELLGGDGVEIARARHLQSDGSEIRTSLVVWVADNGTTLQGTLGEDGLFTDIIFQGVEE